MSQLNFLRQRGPMKSQSLVLVLLSALASSHLAHSRGISPARDPHQDAQEIINFYQNRQDHNRRQADLFPNQVRQLPAFESFTVLDQRSSWDKANWAHVPEWTAEILEKEFLSLREARPLTDHKKRNRRITWLFPDDGCYARAEMMTLGMEAHQVPLASKFFIFGNLSISTPNHPFGSIGWWYHVAPLVRVNSEYYILDPSIEPSGPLKLADWVQRMGDPSTEVAICSPHSYDPDGSCTRKTSSEGIARSDEATFLAQEWQRLLDLRRDPEKELGETSARKIH